MVRRAECRRARGRSVRASALHRPRAPARGDGAQRRRPRTKPRTNRRERRRTSEAGPPSRQPRSALAFSARAVRARPVHGAKRPTLAAATAGARALPKAHNAPTAVRSREPTAGSAVARARPGHPRGSRGRRSRSLEGAHHGSATCVQLDSRRNSLRNSRRSSRRSSRSRHRPRRSGEGWSGEPSAGARGDGAFARQHSTGRAPRRAATARSAVGPVRRSEPTAGSAVARARPGRPRRSRGRRSRSPEGAQRANCRTNQRTNRRERRRTSEAGPPSPQPRPAFALSRNAPTAVRTSEPTAGSAVARARPGRPRRSRGRRSRSPEGPHPSRADRTNAPPSRHRGRRSRSPGGATPRRCARASAAAWPRRASRGSR